MENKLQCSASGALSTAWSRHFNLHPSRRSLCFHPQKPSRAPLSPAPRLNFWPRDPVRTSPSRPLALGNRLSQKHHTLARGAASPPVTSHINGGRARHACVAAYLCPCRCSGESQSARSRANALRSLSGSRTTPLRGSCTPATQTTHQPRQRSGGDR